MQISQKNLQDVLQQLQTNKLLLCCYTIVTYSVGRNHMQQSYPVDSALYKPRLKQGEPVVPLRKCQWMPYVCKAHPK